MAIDTRMLELGAVYRDFNDYKHHAPMVVYYVKDTDTGYEVKHPDIRSILVETDEGLVLEDIRVKKGW